MASLGQLINDVKRWLNRGDIDTLLPGWISMVETDIAEGLRARVMVTRATQAIDGNFIELPEDWLHWESVKDAATGVDLNLEDHWTGPAVNRGGPSTAFRLVGNCIEFLPHPPATLPSGAVRQKVNVAYYAKPRPLQAVSDTNKVLEAHYAVYLFGTCKYGAMFELDDERATQMTAAWTDAVTLANQWKHLSDYSGAPLRAVVRGF